jgi:type IV secretory pathway TraG/TraD family ATPase VirD4
MKSPTYYRFSKTETVPLGSLYVDVQDAFIAAGMMFIGMFAVCFILGSLLPLAWAGFPDVPRPEIFHFTAWYESLDQSTQASFDLRLAISSVFGIAGFVAGLIFGFKPKCSDKHTAGMRFLEGEAASKEMIKISNQDFKRSEKGIFLHPDLQISIDKETKHLMLVGAPGGGKTQTLHGLMRQIFKRKDKMIIYDMKADFTSAYGNRCLLVAPHDKRSAAWDIARDCRTEGAARELASRFIPDSKDPMWSEGARAILVSLIIKLQKEKEDEWNWSDLADLIAQACSDEELLIAIVKRFNKIQAAVVGEDSKTTQSFLIVIAASAALINNLAQAWKHTKQKISFVEWLHDENPEHKRIILQGDGRFSSLTKAYISSIITLLSQEIQSPVFADSTTRKIWFILDEAPTLGKVDILPMITVGRSKGVRVVAAFQDQSQIKEVFGDNVAKTWASSAGTMIIYRVNRGETANWLAEDIVGERTVLRNQVSESFANGGRTTQRSQVSVNLPVIHPNFLETGLGAKDHGVNGLVLGFGDVAGVLTWPYIIMKPVSRKHVPAQWTKVKRTMPPEKVQMILEKQGAEAEIKHDVKKKSLEEDFLPIFDESKEAVK